MSASAYFQPKFLTAHLGAKAVNMTTDTFKVGLIASGTLNASRSVTAGYEFVSDLLANNGSALTEVATGTSNYSRQNLASVSFTVVSNLIDTWTASNPSWPSATFTAEYAWIHDETASSGTDATRPLVAIYDFGGPQSVSGSTFTLTVNASGLAIFTAT